MENEKICLRIFEISITRGRTHSSAALRTSFSFYASLGAGTNGKSSVSIAVLTSIKILRVVLGRRSGATARPTSTTDIADMAISLDLAPTLKPEQPRPRAYAHTCSGHLHVGDTSTVHRYGRGATSVLRVSAVRTSRLRIRDRMN
eukprot:5023372-Pleurochrysis_carterae.AAC.1